MFAMHVCFKWEKLIGQELKKKVPDVTQGKVLIFHDHL